MTATAAPATFPTDLPPWMLKGRPLLPVVQGGMGVGVSAHRLAGAVASLGATGTIASVDLRRHHDDLMAESRNAAKTVVDRANLVALDREILSAKAIARGRGTIAVNVMRAVSEYPAYVRRACESGADAIVVGAGLPLDLPELAADWPGVALVPILSDARGVALVVRKWMASGGQGEPGAMVAAGDTGNGISLCVVYPLDTDLEIARRVNQLEAITHGEGVLGSNFCQTPLGIVGHYVTHVEAAAGFRVAAQVVLGFVGSMALQESVGVSTVGEAFQLPQQGRVKATAGNGVVDGLTIGLAGAGHVIGALGTSFDLERINADLHQTLDVLNGA